MPRERFSELIGTKVTPEMRRRLDALVRRSKTEDLSAFVRRAIGELLDREERK